MTERPSAERRADVRATGLDHDHLVAMGEVAYWRELSARWRSSSRPL